LGPRITEETGQTAVCGWYRRREVRAGMAKPNFSGVYSLKSSENEDAFLKAQGVGWVLRKAAKAGEREKD